MNKPRIDAGKDPFFSAEVGGVLIGVTQLVGSVLAYFTVSKFGRKPLLVWGHLIMGLLWLGIGFATMEHWNVLAMFLIAVFILVFSVTEGPLIWIYTAETLHDNQLGIVGIGLTVNLLIIAYITNFIITWV